MPDPSTSTGTDNAAQPARDTRMIALGSSALMEGFALIGFETMPDANADDLEAVLAELVTSRQRAMLIVERYLARGDGRWLNQVRNEGGRIVIAEVPELHAPDNYHPPVETLVESILGPQALADTAGGTTSGEDKS